MFTIKFLGAAQTVTGSKYLITVNKKHILIDCGLFQGLKPLRIRNWATLPIKPKDIDAVLITHAHLDHSGYIPRLVKQGYTGPIYCTKGTYDLCSILLPDSGNIQEEDARRANKYGYTKHKPALPLYTREEAEDSLKQFHTVDFKAEHTILDNCTATWHHAGHILGAACIELNIEGTKLLFTGDMGRMNDAVMNPPDIIKSTDYLICESTYGDRLHDLIEPQEALAEVINETAARGGSIVIASFAVGRSQSLLYYISQLKQTAKIPDLPVFLDSPMAINATELLCQYIEEHKLDANECAITTDTAICTNTQAESKSIASVEGPKIVISASGMMTGGRILHHLKSLGQDEKNTILITGYQAEGTRGADLLSGKRELKIHGEHIRIKANVEYITNLSAHADYGELLEWLSHFESQPKKVFLTHGEVNSTKHLKLVIKTKLGWDCYIPHYLDEVVIEYLI